MKTGVIFLLLAFVLSISSKKVANDNGKTNSKPNKKASINGPSGALSSKINEVTADELNKLVEDNDFVICYFYDDDQSKAQFSKQVRFFFACLSINLLSFCGILSFDTILEEL